VVVTTAAESTATPFTVVVSAVRSISRSEPALS
jgi:hypothetical protein